jgi:hypothetical protein
MSQTIINVTNFEEFAAPLDEMEHRYWVFRGHGSIDWRIEPTLARYFRSHRENIRDSSLYPREADSIAKFRRSAHLHLKHQPGKEDELGWLAVMQHFGAPTRLVDFTYSPYVALFFALEGAAPRVQFGERLSKAELDARYLPFDVHAVHSKSVRAHTKRILGREGPPASKDYRIGRGTGQTKKFVSFFEGDWQNQRQVAQQGLFMVPSKIDLDIEQFLHGCPSESKSFSNTSWFVFRFPGGREWYNSLVTRLLRANVTAEAIFPGLDGVARSLAMRLYEPRIKL